MAGIRIAEVLDAFKVSRGRKRLASARDVVADSVFIRVRRAVLKIIELDLYA